MNPLRTMMRRRPENMVCVLCVCVMGFPLSAQAASALTYRFDHHLFTIPAAAQSTWATEESVWTFLGREILPPPELRGFSSAALPEGFAMTMRPGWDRTAIEATLRTRIAERFDRDAGSVVITRSASGDILFDGVGLPGRRVDLSMAAHLTAVALEQGVRDIVLPVTELPPIVHVNDPQLMAMGVRELVSVGESAFVGSTNNRIHNITVGLDRFNGHVIPEGATFSFVDVLGPVNASTGYRKELTIIGDRTLPDYGGGLCQVSSTAYRGAWEYGLPIVQRKNHSYAVSYYAPQGTDATVYPPHVDIQFLNDTPGTLLIQTHIDRVLQRAYFLYYGTRDERSTLLAGPFTWNHRSPPPPRTEETTAIAPGERRKVGEEVPGMDVAWFRVLRHNGSERVDGTYSAYQARPLFWQIGVSAQTDSGSLTRAPAEETMLSD